MYKLTTTEAFGITVDDEVRLSTHDQAGHPWHCLRLPVGITLFFTSEDRDNTDDLLGFLDRLHAIRNAVLQDRADASEVAS
jgi:hypothetical protein